MDLRCSNSPLPSFYGTIKTNKEGNSIRPIVSLTNSPTYSLAQHLSKLLTDAAPQKLKKTFEAK